jgi:hypothetical protein
MTDHYTQRAVVEIRHALEELHGKHVYLKAIGDTDPQPYQGFVESIGEATVVLVDTHEATEERPATTLSDAEPATPAMRERTRLRLDQILSVTEVSIAPTLDIEFDDHPAGQPTEMTSSRAREAASEGRG